MSKTDLLILERSASGLEFKEENGVYVLEGVFGELDTKNRNNRIYTAEEYLPQIESLQDKIKASKLLGELDHPQNFDVSLKNVSHIIEEITYDEANKQIKGRIRLLDTDAGRQAKALVDAGVPLQISSRAAGAVESNGKVKIKQLFTYDLVADPGFENAELKRVNESFGFENNSDILIYEIGGSSNLNEETTKIENKQTETMAESKFITVEDFNKYSQYLSEEMKSIKESMAAAKENGNDTEIENLKEYAGYLAEKLDQSINTAEELATKTDQSIQYTESIAEKLDQSIQYSEHIAEGVDSIKEYTNYLAESYNEGATTHEGLLKYIEYLKENLEKVTEYAEYVAETVNSNLILEDEAGKEVEEIEAENDAKDVTEPTVDAEGNELEHGAEVKDVEKDLELEGEGDAEGEEISEEAEAGKEVEEIEAENDAKDVTEPTVDAEGNELEHGAEVKDVEKDLELEGEGDAEGEEISEEAEAVEEAEEVEETEEAEEVEETEEVEAVEETEEEDQEFHESAEVEETEEVEEVEESNELQTYKNEITEKLQSLINKTSENKSKNPGFFSFISESSRNEFNELNEEDQSKVLNAVEGRGFLTEGQILGLWQNALITDAPSKSIPNVISMMPTEYTETWSGLSEAKKNEILSQSKYFTLNTPYQVANFWQTRDLREVTTVMEKVAINEKKEVKPTIGYDTESIALQLKSRFKK